MNALRRPARASLAAVWLPAIALGASIVPVAAIAQPTEPCPPGADAAAPVAVDDVCAARVIGFEPEIKKLGEALCSNASASATTRLEEKTAREFGRLVEECGDALLKSGSVLTQRYLHQWISGPSEGWGEDLKVRGVKPSADLRAYRETITSSYGDGAESSKLPAWYREEAAFSEAVAAVSDVARDYLKGNTWGTYTAETRIERYRKNAGLAEDHPRVRLLGALLARVKATPSDAADAEIPEELWKEFGTIRHQRLTGAAGFYTEACDKEAAKDDSLADAVTLAWASHLLARGAKELEKLDGPVNALKGQFHDWTRAEPAFGAEMTGAFMSGYVKKHYFESDRNLGEVSPEMARMLADGVNAPLRSRYGLPKAAAAEKAGDAVGIAGTRFDSNDNLRVVFPDKCELESVRHVKEDGTAGAILTGHEWDARGIYDKESFAVNKEFPISELVFKEEDRANRNKARSYDVALKCGDRSRRFRINIPPLPDSAEPIDFVTPETAPPYAAMLADGKVNGLLVGGHHTREVDTSVRAMREIGFREVSRKSGVSIRDRFFELLSEKGPDGKPILDYFVKDAHANGYAFDAGMFRANKKGEEIVFEKTGPDGKPHRITVLGNSEGEGDDSPDGFETVDYAKYFDTMAARGDHHLFVANFSCWSDGKTAFEWDGIRSKNVKYLPTDKSATYYKYYWHGLAKRENTFQIVYALDRKMDYSTMRTEFSNFDDEVLMPDDPAFITVLTEKIKSARASSSGIPVRVHLEETRPNS